MSGLTNIINKIEEDNQKTCEKIIAAAHKEVAQLESDMRSRGETQKDKILNEAEKEARLIAQKSESAAVRERENILLENKNKLIDEVIEKAEDKLVTLTSYVDFIVDLAVSEACAGEGEIALNDRDLKQFGSDIVKRINQKLKGDKKIKLKTDPLNIKGGFVLNYDLAVIDDSIDEIINAKTDDIRDKVQEVLFGA